MASTVIQVGTGLRLVNDDGTLTALTLPTGVTLRASVPPRWAVFDRQAVLVNTPSQPLIIDGNGTVRPLCPRPPRVAGLITGAGASTGNLTGLYSGLRYTFLTQDAYGNIISESDYSPASNSDTLAAEKLVVSGLDLSPDSITGRRIYRPIANGSTLFQWVDLDGNILTSITDDTPDAGIALFAAPILGTPPHLTHIAEFRGRLFGVGDDDIDNVRYTEAGIRYAWPADNTLPIPVAGSDDIGVTAFAGRRDALGVGRQNRLVQIIGSGTETDDDVDFSVVTLSKETGILSQESVDVFRDVAYFLWHDGVYEWGPEGIRCISDGTPDGRGNVRSWFATDDYFDRSRFPYAFGKVDPVRYKYRLFLAEPGASSENRWVEFDLKDRTWWGPHRSGIYTPASVFTVVGADNVATQTIGDTTGNLLQEQDTRTDGTTGAVHFDVVTKREDVGEADEQKYFGLLTVVGKAQATGTLDVTVKVGELDNDVEKTQHTLMTRNRMQLGRVGQGVHFQLELENNKAGQDVELYGYELDEVNGRGKR